MALPPGFLDELRARVSIAAVVGRKVTWDSRKTNVARGDYWAPCPFHQEKTASFHVEEAKGRYHYFGCHAGGDVVSFLRETENLGFMEAVERLAADAGMEMPARDPAAAAKAAANQGLVEAMEAAVRFYRAQLNGARAAAARAYLQGRGLTPAALERFEIFSRISRPRASRATGSPRQGSSGSRRRAAPTTASATGSCSRSATAAAG